MKMDRMEGLARLVEELLSGIDAGEFDDSRMIPERYTYLHLYALMKLADQLDGGRQLYEQILDMAVAHGQNRIREKIRNGEKITVAFLAISAAEWPADDVYHLLLKDERIECYIVIVPLMDRDVESRKDTYQKTKKFFGESQYAVREIYDIEKDTCLSWSDLGGLPDVLIHLTPWFTSLPEVCRVTSFPLYSIHCYIPYCFNVSDSPDRTFAVNLTYNHDFINMMRRVYVDSAKNMEGFRRYGMLQGKNTVFSGYVKMDYFYEKREWCEEAVRKIWKIPEGKKVCEMRRVIVAPHHAIAGYGGILLSTFPKNAHFLLYLAQKYRNQISFVFKPHPNLRLRAVEAGVFESYEAYDAYLKAWDLLPNAKVVQEGGYLDIFDTSDGMIMDSASFLAEYLYVNKPLLFLKRSEQAFNRLGAELIKAYDTVWGEDYCGIERFLQEVILDGKDRKKQDRESIWKDNLDYMGVNRCRASEFVYDDICGLLG